MWPCFCCVGSDAITKLPGSNINVTVGCSSRDNGKSRVPSLNGDAGIILACP